MTVGGVPAPRYIQQFAWDYAKYPNRRPLKELVALICGGVTAIDEELKQLGISYSAKQMAELAGCSSQKRRKLDVCRPQRCLDGGDHADVLMSRIPSTSKLFSWQSLSL